MKRKCNRKGQLGENHQTNALIRLVKMIVCYTFDDLTVFIETRIHIRLVLITKVSFVGETSLQGYLAYKMNPVLGPNSRNMSRAIWWP